MPRVRFAVSHRYALVFASLLVLAAAAAIFRHGRAAAQSPETAGVVPTESAATPTDDAQSGTDILLGLARDAMRDGHLVAPAGSNAYEFYLSVLQLEPENRSAREALRESFPRAAVEIEHAINQKQLEEARREIDLLREFDRDNFTLALLGGKLSAARNIVTKQHEVEAARIRQSTAAGM